MNYTEATTTIPQHPTNLQPGCYFDSAHGIYIGTYVIRLAVRLGWKGFNMGDVDNENHLTQLEYYHDIWSDAEDYLNENHCPPHHIWKSTESGDFGLWGISQMSNEDEQRILSELVNNDAKQRSDGGRDVFDFIIGVLPNAYADLKELFNDAIIERYMEEI